MLKIGLAEDDIKIATLVKTGLEEHGYLVTSVQDGDLAFDTFSRESFDLLILDVMMPGKNGIELVKELRKQQRTIPVLMLTAMTAIDDKVTGLNAGADDYLVKPFHFKELIARIEALLRRNHPQESTHTLLNFEDVQLDCDSKVVTRAGKTIELTAKEFTLLELFLKNPNRLLSRQFIAEEVWGLNFDTGTNVIDVYVNFLRKKITQKAYKACQCQQLENGA